MFYINLTWVLDEENMTEEEKVDFIVDQLKMCNVVYYPYRSARVFNGIDLPRKKFEVLEMALTETVGRADNHVVYKIESYAAGDGNPIYIWCTDSLMRIGTTLKEENL